jgi:hypothetical protein
VCEEGQRLERAWLQRVLRTTQGRNRSEPADTQHCHDAMEIDNSVWFKSAVWYSVSTIADVWFLHGKGLQKSGGVS